MKRTIVLFFLFIFFNCSSTNTVQNKKSPDVPANNLKHEIQFLNSKITFELPGLYLWRITDKNIAGNSSKGLIMLKRKVIRDDKGRKIIPAMGIMCVKVPAGVTFNEFMVQSMARTYKGQPLVKLLNYEDGYFTVRAAGGCYYEVNFGGRDHTVISCYMLKNGIGLIVTCNATSGVFAKVETEMLDFIKSIDIQ